MLTFNNLLSRYTKVPERIRYPVAAAFLILIFVAYDFTVRSAQQATLTALEASYRKLDIIRSEKRAYADNLPKYQARYGELQQSLGTARAQLPDSADVPQFLAQLNSSARDVGLSIDRFEPRDEVFREFYSEIAFKMKVHGTYHEVAMFIDQVARIDRIVNVSDISMTAPKVENDKVVVVGALLVKTFRFLSDEVAADIEAKKGKAK